MNLIDQLSANFGVTRRQAEGAAGLLLQLAQKKLPPAAFVLVADTIPAISDIIAKSPRSELQVAGPIRATLSRWVGGLGGLGAVVAGFEQLGLDKRVVPEFAGAIVNFFRTCGGPEVATLLQTVLR